MADRELITDTLFRLLQDAVFSQPVNGARSWVTTSRRLKLWTDVPQTAQPAMYLVEHDETSMFQGRGLPPTRRMHASVFCYAPTGGDSIVGGTLVNVMMSALEDCLRPDDLPGRALTLGGLVNWCRIEGRTFMDPGDIDNQAMLVVPIVMLLP